MTKIEYRLRPVTRYIVTRWEGPDDPRAACANGSTTHGEFDNADTAYAVAYALCKAEHNRLGYPPGDERIKYPEPPAALRAGSIGGEAILPGPDRFPLHRHPGHGQAVSGLAVAAGDQFG